MQARDKARIQLIKTHFGTRIASELDIRSEERSLERGSGRLHTLREEVVEHIVRRLRSTTMGELKGGQKFMEYWELLESDDGSTVHRVHALLRVSRADLDQQVQRWLGKQPHVVKARALRREVARMIDEQRHHAKAGLEAVAARDLARLAPHQHRVRKLRGQLEAAAQRHQRAMGEAIDVGSLESPEVAELEAEVVALASSLTLGLTVAGDPALGSESTSHGAAHGVVSALGLQTQASSGSGCGIGVDYHLHMGLGPGSCSRQMAMICCSLDVNWRLKRCGDGKTMGEMRTSGKATSGCVAPQWGEKAAREKSLKSMASGGNASLASELAEFLSAYIPIAHHQEAP